MRNRLTIRFGRSRVLIVVFFATAGFFLHCTKPSESQTSNSPESAPVEKPNHTALSADRPTELDDLMNPDPVAARARRKALLVETANLKPEPRTVKTKPQDKKPEPAQPAEREQVLDRPLADGEFWIRYKFSPEKKLYYVIENEFKESGGVPGLLTYSINADEQKTIIQNVRPSKPTAKNTPSLGRHVEVSWECDRYKVRDKGMTGEKAFDSLRDLYPTASLRELGAIPGSTTTFLIDPWTGRTKNHRITRGEIKGPVTRGKKLSKVAKHCLLSESNLRRTLDDLGALFFPDSPKRVGDTWTTRRTRVVKSAGLAVTDYEFTLSEIRDVEGRKIARIDVGGKVRLEKSAVEPKKASQPKRKPARPKHDFKIKKQVCNGSIEFDLTRGELVSMALRRELKMFAGTKAKEGKSMSLEFGDAHVFRAAVSQTPPPKPVIVGGPQPPPPEIDKNTPIRNQSKGRQRINTRAAASKKKQSPKARPATRPRSPKVTPASKPEGSGDPGQKNVKKTATSRPVEDAESPGSPADSATSTPSDQSSR